MTSTSTRVRLAVVGAVALAALIAGLAVLLTRGGSAPGTGLTPTVLAPPAAATFPTPPRGAFVMARGDGSDVLALAVVPNASGAVLQVSDVTSEGVGATGLHVSFAVSSGDRTATGTARACGAGCYRASVALPGRPDVVSVHIGRGARDTTWKVPLPASWPAKDASAIVARATRTWKRLKSLRYHERLSSDPRHSVTSSWQIVAPDRLAYQIRGEGQAVIVGEKRWDRQPGAGWVETSALRLHQPTPFWVAATDAYVVDSATIRRRPVWRVSFFDPRTPGWFLAAIDKKTYRTLDVHMTAVAHFMHDAYSGFNTSIKIEPPASG
jgi:hypothetical protein